MLSEEEIKALIVFRLCNCSCNSTHNMCVRHQVRALLAVLNNGEAMCIDDVGDVLDAARIPHEDGDISGEWLAEHGLLHDGKTHPKFTGW